MIGKIFKTGDGLVVTLPKAALQQLGLVEGSEVAITVDPVGQRLIIQRAHRPLDTIEPAFAAHLEAFITTYRPALEALAR